MTRENNNNKNYLRIIRPANVISTEERNQAIHIKQLFYVRTIRLKIYFLIIAT